MRGYNKLIGVALLLLGPLEVLAFLHAPDGRERADWLQFIGRFHSVIVHLPICLVVLAPVLEFMGRCKRWHSLLPAGGFVLGWAALSTVGAMVSGGILAYSGGYAGELVREHMWGGVYLSLVCGLALALRSWVTRKPTPLGQWLYGSALVFGVVVMTWTGHQGGSLTHGDGYLTQRMPARMKSVFGIKEARSKASPGQPADAFYLTHIQPIFDDNCVVCHGSRKRKGGLQMESYADLMKGGEDGPVVTASNPEKSDLYRRITLPGDHKEFMPSDGKKPLTKAQVLLIKQWIDAGASPNKTLKDLKAAGIEVAAPVPPLPPAAPDYRPFAAQIAALEAKLHVRLVPVSQVATDGLTLRTVSEPQRVDDAVLVQLAPVATLIVDVELSRTKVTDKGLPAVAKFVNLRQLDLAGTAVTSAGLTALTPLTKLRRINLVGTAVDDTAVATLRRFPALKEVHAFGSKISESTLRLLTTALEQAGKKAPPAKAAPVKAPAKPAAVEKKAESSVTPKAAPAAVEAKKSL